MQNDLFTIQINAVAINFEIRINDIPLFTMRKGRPTVTELPMNPLIFSGVNEISITIWPTADNDGYPDHASTVFECYQRPIDALRTDRVQIGKVNFPPNLSSPRTKNATLKESIKLRINNDAFNPLWNTATTLSWEDEEVTAVNNVYRKYEQALRKKDINEILTLTLEKDKHYAHVFFTTLAEQQQEQRDFLSEMFGDNNFKIVAFEKHNIRPLICANGKLITFLNQDNRSPLQFYNKEEKITKSFPIYIGKIKEIFTILL